MNKESNFVSAVVYINAGEKRIYEFLNMLGKILENNFKKHEIICVDDTSDDRVLGEISRYKSENTNEIISVVRMGFEYGQEIAMNAGIDLCIGDFVFEFDSCCVDYDDSLVMDVYKKALEGFDIVAASPSQKKSRLTSRIFYKIYNHFSKSGNKLEPERFRIISRRGINRSTAYSKTIPYRKAVYASCGLNIYRMHYNVINDSPDTSIGFADKERKNTAVDSLILFTNFAYKTSILISLIMALFMMVTVTYVIIMYLGMNKPVEGWVSIMSLISVGFFALFVILTIIIKYLDILLQLIFKKQKYLVSEIKKL